ncbi:MAG TPA: hypothetical protein VG013_06230 [Gemmataceae bacterium]|jgi:hypothetical protein|nr:hypothetical protein [Gemmataceae bacterium]
MRIRMAWLVVVPVAGAVGFAVLSLSRGQDGAVSPSPASADPGAHQPGVAARVAQPAAAGKQETPVNLGKLSLLQRQMYQSARRGADWLRRANRADGRFNYGHVPDLGVGLEGDHYLRQTGAAFALARAARFFGDEGQAAVARQALLALLLDTMPDPKNARVRYTSLPPVAVNRLAAAGLLVLAVNELPSPGADLLEQSEQLCAFIRGQQRADGSLDYGDGSMGTRADPADPDGINYYPGEALYALMRSQRHRPAAWKTDVVRKARAYYQPWWRAHKNMALVPWQTAAYTEAYLATKEAPFADCVNEMTDWICEQQYTQLDPRHPLWVGGFMGWADGKQAVAPPQVGSAAYAEGLAEACRVARQAGDLQRYQRYRDALERCLQFVTTLQYTEASTRHFADWYRPVLLGAFYASHQDGTLRIDYTQHAVCALVQYLSDMP